MLIDILSEDPWLGAKSHHQGYKFRVPPGGSGRCIVFGKKGAGNCATIMELQSGFDVAIHDESPKVIEEALSQGRILLGSSYLTLDPRPGWGLILASILERELED